jgi:hypothetical protein
MSANRIDAIGLELEGGWAETSRARRLVKHDGSVRGIDGNHVAGEVNSPPLSDFAACEAWLRENYPQQVNESCGFHVHVSLKPLHYSRIMNPGYEPVFLEAMEDLYTRFRGEPAFAQFRERLDGQNQYCQKIFRPEDQLWRREPYGDRVGAHALPRYSQLNYCWGRHGTMECRLFPCFPQVQHAIEACKSFIDSINNFLATCPPEKPITVTVEAETQTNGPRSLAAAA